MLKRVLVIATVAFAAQAGSAFASEWAFDDAYWKTGSMGVEKISYQSSQQTDTAFSKYEQVDRYNP